MAPLLAPPAPEEPASPRNDQDLADPHALLPTAPKGVIMPEPAMLFVTCAGLPSCGMCRQSHRGLAPCFESRGRI